MDSMSTVLFYLQAESLLIVYTSLSFSRTQASLSLVPVGIGCLLDFFPRFYDKRVLKSRRSRGQELEPENKLSGLALGAPALAVGLWWFAWTIPPQVHTHWIVSMLALIPIGFAVNEITFVLHGYLADSYTVYSASACASTLLARCILVAAVLPFAHDMYTEITPNVATAILAAFATTFCISPYVLLKYGKRIRKASPFAQTSLEIYTEHQVEDDLNIIDTT